MLTFLISELQEAEDEGQKVMIIGHVLPGWAAEDPTNNPTNMFQQIVDVSICALATQTPNNNLILD
jgi:sphingomyelin phosphodiesterase